LVLAAVVEAAGILTGAADCGAGSGTDWDVEGVGDVGGSMARADVSAPMDATARNPVIMRMEIRPCVKGLYGKSKSFSRARHPVAQWPLGFPLMPSRCICSSSS